MITKFGIKEAKAAGRFAKTKEQKETVFAMLAMFGVVNVVKDQVVKWKLKISKRIAKNSDKAVALRDKTLAVENTILADETAHDVASAVHDEWTL